MYVWSWICGKCDTNNDKTMHAFSTLFIDILCGRFDLHLPHSYCVVPGIACRQLGYFLADGIYHTWSIFVIPIHEAPTEAQRRYSRAQEATKKDIERVFRVMQARFRIRHRESELWSVGNLVAVTEVCAIVQNLLVRMEQSGVLDKGVSAEGGTVNIVTQFLDEENERLRERGSEVACQEVIPGTAQGRSGSDDGERAKIDAFLEELEVMHDVITGEAQH